MPTQPIPPVPQQKISEGAGGTSKSKFEPVDVGIDDKISVEVELACHSEMREIAARIKGRLDKFLSGTEPAQLFFLDDALRMALDLSDTVEIQLQNLKDAYAGASATANAGLHHLTPPAPLQEPRIRTFSVLERFASPTVAVDAAVALLGALRTDTRYFGRQVVISEQAFAFSLGHQWEDRTVAHFHYPTIFVPPTNLRSELLKDFVQALDTALEERKQASQLVSNLLSQFSQLAQADPRFPYVKASLDFARDQFQAAESVFDDLSANLARSDQKTGLTQFQLLERSAFVKSIASQAVGRTFYLFAQVVSAGGGYRTERNFLRALFWDDALGHAGGCIVSFGLFNDSGTLLASDTIGGRSGYLNSRPAIMVD